MMPLTFLHQSAVIRKKCQWYRFTGNSTSEEHPPQGPIDRVCRSARRSTC